MQNAAQRETEAGGGQPKPTRLQWRLIALLVLSVGINYIDRGSLSIAAPALSRDLLLTPAQMGLLSCLRNRSTLSAILGPIRVMGDHPCGVIALV